MSLTPFAIERFGGLNLNADLEEVGFGGAIDTSNIDLQPGRVRARDGTSLYLTAGANIVLAAPYTHPVNGRFLIVATTAATNNIAAYRYDGTIVGLPDTLAGTGLASPVSAAHIGTQNLNYLYVAAGQPTMARFDGSTWVNTTMPQGNVLGVTPFDNRLVVGAISGLLSRVRFSDNDQDAVDPTNNFATNNYIDLEPGDGEQILDMASYGGQLFVFKRSKYFVFYGTSTDPTGKPIFDYHAVDAGIGCMSWHCAAAARDGVYFLHDTGVYRTTGMFPVKVSEALDPFFRGIGSPAFLNGAVHDPSRGGHVSCVGGRVYVQVNHTGPGVVIFVFDPVMDAWWCWTPPTTVPLTGRVPVTEIQASSLGGTTMVMAAGTGVYRSDRALATDAGAVFSTSYQSGFSDMGRPVQEKTIRETELVGSGSPQFEWMRDFESSSGSHSVSLSSGRGRQRYAQYGELLSYRLSGTGPWEVRRVVPMVRETSGVGGMS